MYLSVFKYNYNILKKIDINITAKINYITKMTTKTLRYSLEEFDNLIFNGFDYQIPEKTIEIISNLAIQVGSPGYDKTPVFKKRENTINSEITNVSQKDVTKKRRGKAVEISNNDEWNSMRKFQTTKIEAKTGIEGDFDLIRSFINKITDKNYIDMRNKIIEVIDKIVFENSKSNLINISTNIFEVASSNRYYSKIYADLYSDLSQRYDFIKEKYQENIKQFIDLFSNIEYVDPNENYDKFCEINKINEKRKSLATFYVNLMNNGVVSKNEIMQITRNLLDDIYKFILLENKKNEVEELTETVALLYKKDLYEFDCADKYERINGYTISEIIEKIAKSKVKDYKSLTNKALFKFMDLIDM